MAVEIDGRTGQIDLLPPQPGKRYRTRLGTLAETHHEACRVYRECRSGLLSTGDCSKLIFCLRQMASMLEGGDIEKRLLILEGNESAIVPN